MRVADKYVVGYNSWRKQWEFPAGRIDNGETAREAAIRELYEETHQRNEQLEFRGLFRVEDAKGQIKYQAIFTCQGSHSLAVTLNQRNRLWNRLLEREISLYCFLLQN